LDTFSSKSFIGGNLNNLIIEDVKFLGNKIRSLMDFKSCKTKCILRNIYLKENSWSQYNDQLIYNNGIYEIHKLERWNK